MKTCFKNSKSILKACEKTKMRLNVCFYLVFQVRIGLNRLVLSYNNEMKRDLKIYNIDIKEYR